MTKVEQLIQSRKTSKVLLAVELRHEQQALWTDDHTNSLRDMLRAAAWAPFHKKANPLHCEGTLDAPMPWRFHVLNGQSCTELLAFLDRQAKAYPDSKWSRAWQSRIKEMVSACGVLVQATWLPEPAPENQNTPESDTLQLNHKNIEHVAAASSAVQSLLLAAQSRDWLSYWSSGGILRDEDIFDYLGISRREKLLGSIFLSPGAHPAAKIIEGGLRDQRGELSGWVNWV